MSGLVVTVVFILAATALGLSIASLAHSNHQHTGGGSGTTIQPTPAPTRDIYAIVRECQPLAVFNTPSTAVTGTITIASSSSSLPAGTPVSGVPIPFTVTNGTSTTANPVLTDAAGYFSIDVTATVTMSSVRLAFSIPGDSFGTTVEQHLCVLTVVTP